MEINNFLNMDFLAGFAGTIVGVELMVYCTKELPFIKKIPTRIYTFLLAVIHLFIVKYAMGALDLTLGNVYLLTINSFLISTVLCGGYDIAIGNIQIPEIINGKKKNVSIDIQPDDDNKKNQSIADSTAIDNTTSTAIHEEEIAGLSNRGRNSNINDKTI